MGTVIAMPLSGFLAEYISWDAIFYVFGKIDRQIDAQIDREMDRQIDRQMDRWIERQRDRQIDIISSLVVCSLVDYISILFQA